MIRRLSFFLLFATVLTNSALAQVVRFQTTLGDFDMVLNPTHNPLLQGNVDNILQYVNDNRYSSSWINRAAEGFVLQMGSLYSHTTRPPLTIESTRPVVAFDPVQGAPAASVRLSNTVGTVALALPADSRGTPLDNLGTSSFFINLGSNANLNQHFTVFAAIPDMTVVNQIMALTQRDLTTDQLFGATPNSLTFTDVPLMDDGKQVFIKRAFVVQDAMTIANATAKVAPLMAASTAAFNFGGSGTLADSMESDSSAISSPTIEVPEPATSFLTIVGTLSPAVLATRRWRG